MSRGNTAQIVFSITLKDNVAKDLSCRKSTYPSADKTVNMHLPLPPPLGTPGNPEVMPEPRDSGKRLEDCLVASGPRDNTSVGFTGTQSPSPNLAIDGEGDSSFLCLNRAELKTTGNLKPQTRERHGNPVTTSSRAGMLFIPTA